MTLPLIPEPDVLDAPAVGVRSRFWQRWSLSYVGVVPILWFSQLLLQMPRRLVDPLEFFAATPMYAILVLIFAAPAAAASALLAGLVEWVGRPQRTTPWAGYAVSGAIAGAIWMSLLSVDITIAQGAVIGAGGALCGGLLTGPIRRWWLRPFAMVAAALVVAVLGLMVGVPNAYNPFR